MSVAITARNLGTLQSTATELLTTEHTTEYFGCHCQLLLYGDLLISASPFTDYGAECDERRTNGGNLFE
jgi:hypothetical protein